MNRIKLSTLLSLAAIFMFMGCNVDRTDDNESFSPLNEDPTEDAPLIKGATSMPETAVTPTPPENGRLIRLTAVVTPDLQFVPTTAVTPVVGEVPQSIITAVYEDLQTHTNAQKEAITVAKSEAVIWNDGALGCPQPDAIYTQEPIEGYWVILKSGTETFDYRVRQNGTFFLCEESLKP